MVIYDTVYSTSLEGNFLGDSPNRPVNIYLPPGYEENQNLSYPVIYLLHGFSHTQDTWLPVGPYLNMNIKSILDNLFLEGKIQPMIVVMPNGYNRYHGSWYTNSLVTGNWEDFILKDLIGYIDENYRTIPQQAGRGIAGHSMGGTGAFKIAMKHPDIYSAVFSLSAGFISFEHNIMGSNYKEYLVDAAKETDATQFDSFYWKKQVMIAGAAAFAPDTNSLPFYGSFPVDDSGVLIDTIWAKWLEHDPYTIFGAYKSNLLQLDSIWIECGTLDDVYDSNHYMHLALDSAGIVHSWETYSGGHSDKIGQRIETKMLPFFSDILEGNYSKSTAMARSMQSNPNFIPTTGETLIINAQLYNPENHPVQVHAVIHGDQHAFTDSIPLYDDGQHSDSLVSDNIWGNSKWLSGLPEDIYPIGITTYDKTEDYKGNLPPFQSFTTIGPIEVESATITSSDKEPNPGDYLKFLFKLQNKGSNAAATGITSKVIPIDTCLSLKSIIISSYGDITPGEIVEGDRAQYIQFSDKWSGESPINIALEIYSNGYHFWTDTVDLATGIEDYNQAIVREFKLSQNYPNPFNPNTVISWQVGATCKSPVHVDLSIYNLLGQKVATLVSEKMPAGYHEVEFNGQNLSSGVYLYKIEVGEWQDVRKMVLIR